MPKPRNTPLKAAYARLNGLLRELGDEGRSPMTKGTGTDAFALQSVLELQPDAGLRLALREAAKQLVDALDGQATPLPSALHRSREHAVNPDQLALMGADGEHDRPNGVPESSSSQGHDNPPITNIDQLVLGLRALDLASLSDSERDRLSDAATPVVRELAALGEPNVTRSLLDGLAVGSILADIVFDTDPALLGPDGQVSYMQASQRIVNAATARLDAGLVAFLGANPRNTIYYVDGSEHALIDARALEVSLAMCWSDQFTRQRIATARALKNDLPGTSAVARVGQLVPVVCAAIVEGAQALTADLDAGIETAIRGRADAEQVQALRELRTSMLSRFEDALLPYATDHTLTRVKARIRRAIHRIDPDGSASRRAIAARVTSKVELRHLPDGMSMLTAIMPSDHATACFKAIDELARQPVLDATEPMGLRRVNALHSLILRSWRAATGSADAGEPSLPVHLDLVMDIDAFLGLSDTAAELVGVGALPAAAARTVLANAEAVRIRRVLTEPRTGRRLDVGVRRYTLTDSERRYILERDRHCRFKDCNAPAVRCECDHAIPYEQGGRTATANLGAACKRHHQHKTHAGWKIIDSRDDGYCVWESPLGRTYAHEPEPPLPGSEFGSTDEDEDFPQF